MGRVSKRSAKKRESLHNYKERSTRMKLEVENSKLVHFRFNIRSSNFTNNTKKYKWHLNQEWKWRKLSRARCELIAAIDIYPENWATTARTNNSVNAMWTKINADSTSCFGRQMHGAGTGSHQDEETCSCINAKFADLEPCSIECEHVNLNRPKNFQCCICVSGTFGLTNTRCS